jgi:hypothetical protein
MLEVMKGPYGCRQGDGDRENILDSGSEDSRHNCPKDDNECNRVGVFSNIAERLGGRICGRYLMLTQN